MSGERDEMAADALADREGVECRECGGTGEVPYGFNGYHRCYWCNGTGYWKAAP